MARPPQGRRGIYYINSIYFLSDGATGPSSHCLCVPLLAPSLRASLLFSLRHVACMVACMWPLVSFFIPDCSHCCWNSCASCFLVLRPALLLTTAYVEFYSDVPLHRSVTVVSLLPKWPVLDPIPPAGADPLSPPPRHHPGTRAVELALPSCLAPTAAPALSVTCTNSSATAQARASVST